ncbi:M23 family metallopeptidase [Stenotrophomonas terrae]|uniref:M23 family metallopeptidase n=1 Tax=Stenotrophomonas terrae TaxID=405446 RepID=UPI003D35BD9D
MRCTLTSSPRITPLRATGLLLLLVVLSLAGNWLWQQPFSVVARESWKLSRLPAPTAIAVPVQGIKPRQIADTFGAPRGRDRKHHGVDIFAKRGTPVLAATDGVAAAVRDSGLGGRQVWVIGPAGQRHYYAHLQDWVPGLAYGRIVQAGDVLGFVGDSGNARGTPPHLHYGIYAGDGPFDPLPLMHAGQPRKR